MQSISPLTLADFKNKSNIVIGKAEIDSDGAGTYVALPDIIDFSITTNIENQVGRLNSYSFSITVLNTDNQFYPYNTTSAYYGYLKQGRRIKLYAGIKVSGTDYYYQWLIGRIDDYNLSKQAGNNICTIIGRDFMRIITDYKLYSPNTYWGTTETFNTVSGQVRYNMNASCKGAYIAYLDSTSPYDGSNLEPIYENTDWSYDWHNNQFCFLEQRIPDFAGTNNLVIYYMTTQTVENVVGHILYLAGIFATTAARDTWIADASYVTPTAKTIDRVWFNTGTSALEAIRLLAEVVQYRLYFDYAGNPVFKPKASTGIAVENLYESDIDVKNTEENNEETYTHIIVTGEERDRVPGDDEIAPAVPTGLALTTGMGSATQASLSWIKATWNANTEIDFGHYELRYKKNADSDYTEVSTIALSYIIYGLEPGVTYNVQVKACDIYENRSAWSTAVNQVTATDSTAPAQITGVTVIALFAGIKVNWTQSTENNISYYLVERQESPDNVDWSGAWTEKVRTNATMWLDLLLTYSKYYRYRVTAYTVTGTAGTTSAVSTALQPNQAATADIAAASITATELATDAVTAIKIQASAVTEGKIATNAVVADKIYAGSIGTAKLAALAVIADKIAASAITTVKINALAVTADCIAASAVTVDKIAANSITANKYNELRNTYVFNGDDSLDASFPFELDFEIVSEMTAINSVKLSFRISQFRAYATAASSGGAVSSASGGGATPTSGVNSRGHSHIVPTTNAATGTAVTYSAGVFYCNIGGAGSVNTTADSVDHTHTVTIAAHTHTGGAHTHGITYGIFEDSQTPTIHYHIDNGAGFGAASGNFTTDQLDIAITGSISGTGFKRIKFDSDVRCRIRAWVLCKIDLSA